MKSSPKTTVVGFLLLAGAVIQVVAALMDGDPSTQPDFSALITALGGVGLIFAKDSNK